MYVHVSVKGILVKALGTRNSLVSYKEYIVFHQFYFQKQESNGGKVNASRALRFKRSNNSYFNENDIKDLTNIFLRSRILIMDFFQKNIEQAK